MNGCGEIRWGSDEGRRGVAASGRHEGEGRASAARCDGDLLDGRFLLWRGASGRLYVFSALEVGEDAGEALVVAHDGGAGRKLWAHYLAGDAAARRRARMDLEASAERPRPFAGTTDVARVTSLTAPRASLAA